MSSDSDDESPEAERTTVAGLHSLVLLPGLENTILDVVERATTI
jgi:hypothetical protein